jgi:hypothetical protein
MEVQTQLDQKKKASELLASPKEVDPNMLRGPRHVEINVFCF